jgi:predicted nucleotidyltransferase
MTAVLPSVEERRRLLQSEIDRYLPILIRLGARKVVLIGSLASGVVHEMSDLDLIVILETPERFLDRLERLWDALDPRVSLDLLVYTPPELDDLKTWSSFIDQALKTGKVLHDAGS